MIQKLDERTAQHFVVAIAALMRFETNTLFVQTKPLVKFTCTAHGDAEDRRHMLATAEKEKMDIVSVEFEPGKEHEGPRNITVLQHWDGKLWSWRQCTLWGMSDGEHFFILPKGLNYGFGFDGRLLVRVEDCPTSGLGRGMNLARMKLKEAARMAAERDLDISSIN